jgi:hypothetical protein
MTITKLRRIVGPMLVPLTAVAGALIVPGVLSLKHPIGEVFRDIQELTSSDQTYTLGEVFEDIEELR